MTTNNVASLLPSLSDTGKRLIDAGELYNLLLMLASSKADIAGAAAPGTLVNATYNQVVSGTNVQLPFTTAGRSVTVINNAGAALTVNAQASNPNNGGVADTIGGAATASIPNGSAGIFVAIRAGEWIEMGSLLSPGVPLAAEAPAPAAPTTSARRTAA